MAEEFMEGISRRVCGRRRQSNLVSCDEEVGNVDMNSLAISCLQESLVSLRKLAPFTQIYPADLWHRVVIHNIPLWWEQNSVVTDKRIGRQLTGKFPFGHKYKLARKFQ